MSKNQFSALEDRTAAALEKLDTLGGVLSPSVASGDAKVLPRGFAPLPVVQLTCAADIKPEPIRWLWPDWLARGKFHIFAGMAGTGKTTIAIAIGSTISQGGRFPDGTRAPVGNVLIWSGEDTPNQNAQRIAGLLHQTRSASWTIEQTHELVAAVREASEVETKLALLSYTMGMLTASRSCLMLQRDAALIEQVLAERDESGGHIN